jgi:hypothetical protein
LDPNPEHWEGKRGACVGVFQRIVAGQQNKWVKHTSYLHIFLPHKSSFFKKCYLEGNQS